MKTKYEFCRSPDSKKVHIREKQDGVVRRPDCGAGGYGYYSDGFSALAVSHSKYPKSLKDVCKTCREMKTHGAFLIEVDMKEKPEAVTSCIYVDINLPTKTMVPLSEAREIMELVTDEIERFAGIDTTGVCVKFNLNEY